MAGTPQDIATETSTANYATFKALGVDTSDTTDSANGSGRLLDLSTYFLPIAGGELSGNITFSGAQTVDGRDVSVDGAKLDGIEAAATADQSDAEIEAAYNNQVSVVTQVDAEAGTSTTVHRWTPQRVSQAIAAIGGGSFLPLAGGTMTGDITFAGTQLFDGRDVSADGATLDAVATTYLPLAGGTLTGDITFAGTQLFDGRDVSADGATLDAVATTYLPLAGGTMTGDIAFAGTQLFDGRDVSADGAKLDGIQSAATADQSDSEIETAYNNQVSVVTQGDAEAGTSTTVYRWTPQRVAQAIAALEGGGGLYASVAVLEDQKASGTDGGSATSGSFETRTINTEVSDSGGIVSISANQFTLDAGSYEIEFSAPAYDVGSHQTQIYNVTDASVALLGETAYTTNASTVTTHSRGTGIITIAGTKAFELQHRVSSSKATDGHGRSTSWGTEVYSRVVIRKLA